MSTLCKLVRLPAADRRLCLQAAVLLWAIRVGLWLLPFSALCRTLSVLMRSPAAPVDLPAVRIGRLVAAASRYVPRATCLAQALAAQVFVARAGYPTSLRIGVGKGDAGEFLSHAWVESDGRIVIGGADLARYTPILALEATPR